MEGTTYCTLGGQVFSAINRSAHSDKVLQASLGRCGLQRHDRDIVDVLICGEFESEQSDVDNETDPCRMSRARIRGFNRSTIREQEGTRRAEAVSF